MPDSEPEINKLARVSNKIPDATGSEQRCQTGLSQVTQRQRNHGTVFGLGDEIFVELIKISARCP